MSWREELQNHIDGQVVFDDATLDHYSSDGSIFVIRPQAVVLPANSGDIKAVVGFVRKFKEEHLSITCRGKGTDLTGGSVNASIIFRFSGYLDDVIAKSQEYIQVQSGVIYAEMNKQLAEYGTIVPVDPASGAFCSVGGMVANNSGGIKSVKYGETRDYVRSLRVVLSDGSDIETKALDKDQLKEKLALQTLEGELYRNVKKLIEENKETIQRGIPRVSKNASGYQLWSVMPSMFSSPINIKRDYAFDLSQLFIGSQGTLGIIKDITFRTIPKPNEDGVLVGYIKNLRAAGQAIQDLLKMNPSSLEIVDSHVIEVVKHEQPELTANMGKNLPELVLFCEFDGSTLEEVSQHLDLAEPIMKKYAYFVERATDPAKEAQLWALRKKSATVIEHMRGDKRAVPLEFDGAVPSQNFVDFIDDITAIFKQYKFNFATWGHAGDGNIHIRPIIDITKKKDRDNLVHLASDLYGIFAKYHGTASGEHGDGLEATPFLEKTYGKDMLELFKEIKKLFDPSNIFNPMKKVGATEEVYEKYLRQDFAGYYRPKI